MKHHYCSGSCHGQPSEEEVVNGKTVCDSSGCAMEGKSFVECDCDNLSNHHENAHGSSEHHEHDQG